MRPNRKKELKRLTGNTYCIKFEPVISTSSKVSTVLQILLCVGVYALLVWAYLGATCR